jgi:hypothetical protein
MGITASVGAGVGVGSAVGGATFDGVSGVGLLLLLPESSGVGVGSSVASGHPKCVATPTIVGHWSTLSGMPSPSESGAGPVWALAMPVIMNKPVNKISIKNFLVMCVFSFDIMIIIVEK